MGRGRGVGVGGAGSGFPQACGQPGVVAVWLPRPPSAVEVQWRECARLWWLEGRPAWVQPGWYDAPLRAEVRDLLQHEPGPQLASALAALGEPSAGCPADHSGESSAWEEPLGVAGSPCACMVVVAAAWEAVASWSAQRAQQAVLAAAGDEPVVDGGEGRAPTMVDPAREELAAALCVSPASMANRLHTLRRTAAVPTLGAGALQGLWSSWTATLLGQDLQALDAESACEIADLLTTKVSARHRRGLRPWTATELRRVCARLVARHAPDAAARARGKARRGRRVEVDHGPHGMSWINAHIPTLDAERIHRRLSAAAAGLDDPTRSHDHKRADVFTDLLLGRCPHPAAQVPADDPSAPSAAGAQITVLATLPMLLGLSENPGEVVGVGPVDPDTARALAADGQWTAWITDAAGRVTATSTHGYTPSPALARLVRAREPRCRMPGCTRRAEACDLDHTIPWPRGSTRAANLGPLCRRHHNQKTHRRWRLANHPGPDGQAHTAHTWTTPAGITITDDHPPPLEPSEGDGDPPDTGGLGAAS